MKINSSKQASLGIANEIADKAQDSVVKKAAISSRLKSIQQSKCPVHPKKRVLAQYLAESAAAHQGPSTTKSATNIGMPIQAKSSQADSKHSTGSQLKSVSTKHIPLVAIDLSLSLRKISLAEPKQRVKQKNEQQTLSDKSAFPVNAITKSHHIYQKIIKIVQLQQIIVEDSLAAEQLKSNSKSNISVNPEYQTKNYTLEYFSSKLQEIKNYVGIAPPLSPLSPSQEDLDDM